MRSSCTVSLQIFHYRISYANLYPRETFRVELGLGNTEYAVRKELTVFSVEIPYNCLEDCTGTIQRSSLIMISENLFEIVEDL